MREVRIPVTALNPGNIAAEIPHEAGAEPALQTYDGTRIPMQEASTFVAMPASTKPRFVREEN